MPDLDEYIEEIRGLWDSRWLTNMGIKHEELKKRLKEYLDTPNLELFTNGHMAIELSLMALDLPRGSEVITTPFTFASTTHAIVRNGLKPIFCDIDPISFCIDADKVEALITRETRAIVPVHVYGNICDVERIDDIARRHFLKVLYDAAHTFGESLKGVGVANFGDVSCFSFHATKVFNTIEGGASSFRDPALLEKLQDLKNFGYRDQETIVDVGANAKMNEFQAAFGICNLKHLDSEIAKRRRVAERYTLRLKDIPGLRINVPQKDVVYNYSYYPLVIDPKMSGTTRDEVSDMLKEHNIYARKYFYPLVTDYECYKDIYDSAKTPVALKISHEVLTLPIYPDLALDKVDEICDIIISCARP